MAQGLDFIHREQSVEVRSHALMIMAEAYQGPVADIRALERFNQALSAIEAIQDPQIKLAKLHQAITFIQGQVEFAETTPDWDINGLFNQILKAAYPLDDSDEKSFLFWTIADMTPQLSEDTAHDLVNQFLVAANKAPTIRGRVEILRAIATIQINQQAEAAAAAQLTQALDWVAMMQDENEQASVIYRIAEVAAILSDEAMAQELIEQGLTLINGMQDDYAKARGLTVTIRVAHPLSDGASVQRLVDQTIAIASSFHRDHEWNRATALSTLATTLVKMTGSP